MKTLSALVGTDAPPAPPLAADQLVVFVASQVPVPPTQYLFAIDDPCLRYLVAVATVDP